MGRVLPTLTLGLALLLGAGCTGRTLPIPPPVSSVFSSTCEPATCPGGGRVVVVRGTAVVGALVVAENLSRRAADGSPFMSVTVAQPVGDADGGPDAGGDGGAGSQRGRFEMCLCPRPDGAGGVLAAQPNDRIRVYQIVETDEGPLRSLADDTLSVPP